MDADPLRSTPPVPTRDASTDPCAFVAENASDLVVGDLPVAMREELRAHVAGCAGCRREVESVAAAASALARLPVEASAARTWLAIRSALRLEREARPMAWTAQVAALVAAALVMAAGLVQRSGDIADWLAARFALDLPAWLCDSLAASGAVRPFVLPALFVAFGASVALAALPLLATAGGAPIGDVLVRRARSVAGWPADPMAR